MMGSGLIYSSGHHIEIYTRRQQNLDRNVGVLFFIEVNNVLSVRRLREKKKAFKDDNGLSS